MFVNFCLCSKSSERLCKGHRDVQHCSCRQVMNVSTASSHHKSSSSANTKIHQLLFIRINYSKQSADWVTLALKWAGISLWQIVIPGECFSWIKSSGTQQTFKMTTHTADLQQPCVTPMGITVPPSTKGLLLLASSWAWLGWCPGLT